MDPISLLVGGGVLLAGFIAGRANRRPKLADSTMCAGCEHSITYRDPQTGHCIAQVEQANKWDGAGGPIGFVYVPCTCASHATADQLLMTTWERPALGIKQDPTGSDQ